MLRRLMFASSLLMVGLTQNGFCMEAVPTAPVQQLSVGASADSVQKLVPAGKSVVSLTEIKQLGEPSLKTFYMIPVGITVINNTDEGLPLGAPYFASNDQTFWNGGMIRYKMRNFFRKATPFCFKRALELNFIAFGIVGVRNVKNFFEDGYDTQSALNRRNCENSCNENFRNKTKYFDQYEERFTCLDKCRGMFDNLDATAFSLATVCFFLTLIGEGFLLFLTIGDDAPILKPHAAVTIKGYVSKAGMEKMAAMVKKA